ncbi:hypothetical protein ENSA5_57600 [Enhygromyxa salina]|uniref:Probable inorganic carbon transporter subunit DabA n=1 Tax=Enhygromyxa salina TaxID=215803 RepID=A0A2S9XE88_9BACT|nr:putative inorganic carbon transporter subunit DabA [Enhygromyxa salina]PRP91188.1 hypothetical protein ENSA5_57600 [Enhygromyxa salina]
MIGRALEHAVHSLPDQAPLEMFVHHNTLHALQEHAFHDALQLAHQRFGARVYRDEAAFRQDLAEGRIDRRELERELERELRREGLDGGESLTPWSTRRELYSLALRVDLRVPTRAALRWRVREERFDRSLAAMRPEQAARTIASSQASLREFTGCATPVQLVGRFLGPTGTVDRMPERYGIPATREAILALLDDDPEPLVAGAMWQACRALARELPLGSTSPSDQPQTQTPRDVALARLGVDIWNQLHPELLRWAAAYLDEGLAYWPMPGRERGFFVAVRDLCAQTGPRVVPWLGRARRIFAELAARDARAREAIVEALEYFAIPEHEIDALLLALLRATPGFAGMFSRLERHPHERSPTAPPTSLEDFCAVRLVLERAAFEQLAADHGIDSFPALLARSSPAEARRPHPDAYAAYRLFVLAQHLGLTLEQVDALDADQAARLLRELDGFDELARGRVFLEAFERRYRAEILDGFCANRSSARARSTRGRPSIQVVACIDDREESFRRHIEELDPDAETFGAAGSFGLAIDYRSCDAGGHIALAPAGVRPSHEIVERAVPADAALGDARQSRRRRWGRALHQFFFGSRSGLRGALASLVLGPVAWIPLGARVLAPRSSMRALDQLGTLALPRPRTRLANDDAGATSARGLACGYDFDEQVDRVYSLVEGMGLRERFAPLVFLLAHGSTSLNNPHEAAHDCGACGGRRGGATARLLAIFANDPKVRAEVAARGIEIPDDTWFVAGEHDTADDRVELYDLDLVPADFSDALARAVATLDRARALNGHERARKFEMAALSGDVEAGLRHVEGRASHLGEPRPEYGHCTNAICIIGPRSSTRGLFLDRRAFLVSYDPTSDPEGAVLERLLAIAGPVGAGINLEYYFSIVDPEVFGAGTKLPHNICGYLGVLNGTSGDLRTGLPLQMTEIHEPMRLLVIVEARPDTLLAIAGRQPILAELITNGWIQLVSVDPDSGEMQVFEDGRFVTDTCGSSSVPTAPSSRAYYARSREFLPPARIVPEDGGRS